MTHHHEAGACQFCNRLDLLGHVEAQLHDVGDLADHRVRRDEHRVAIVRRLHQVIDRQCTAGARLRIDDHGPVQLLLQALRQHASYDVTGASGWHRHDNPQRLVG
ncbi:hypothetical protein D3C72_1771900 [compost metagenome]